MMEGGGVCEWRLWWEGWESSRYNPVFLLWSSSESPPPPRVSAAASNNSCLLNQYLQIQIWLPEGSVYLYVLVLTQVHPTSYWLHSLFPTKFISLWLSCLHQWKYPLGPPVLKTWILHTEPDLKSFSGSWICQSFIPPSPSPVTSHKKDVLVLPIGFPYLLPCAHTQSYIAITRFFFFFFFFLFFDCNGS